MSQELLYTSAPKGLKSGTHGFCMVLCSEGMPAPLATALEGLSAYKPVYPVGDPAEDRNPVTAMHVILPAIGRKQHVLSRVASYGLDYSGRPNKLAHHVVLEPRDFAPAGPAWMLTQTGVMKKEWSGEPRIAAANRPLPAGDIPPAPCREWARVTGDAGWAGVLAESLMKDPARQAYLIIKPGFDTLPLFAEAIALLPADRRWQATFSTYYTTLPAGAICNWRCLLADSPLVHQSKRHVHALRLDLTAALGKAPEGEWVEFARTGRRMRPTADPAPIPAAASPTGVSSENSAYDLAVRIEGGVNPQRPPRRKREHRQEKRSLGFVIGGMVAGTASVAAIILMFGRASKQADVDPRASKAANREQEIAIVQTSPAQSSNAPNRSGPDPSPPEEKKPTEAEKRPVPNSDTASAPAKKTMAELPPPTAKSSEQFDSEPTYRAVWRSALAANVAPTSGDDSAIVPLPFNIKDGTAAMLLVPPSERSKLYQGHTSSSGGSAFDVVTRERGEEFTLAHLMLEFGREGQNGALRLEWKPGFQATSRQILHNSLLSVTTPDSPSTAVFLCLAPRTAMARDGGTSLRTSALSFEQSKTLSWPLPTSPIERRGALTLTLTKLAFRLGSDPVNLELTENGRLSMGLTNMPSICKVERQWFNKLARRHRVGFDLATMEKLPYFDVRVLNDQVSIAARELNCLQSEFKSRAATAVYQALVVLKEERLVPKEREFSGADFFVEHQRDDLRKWLSQVDARIADINAEVMKNQAMNNDVMKNEVIRSKDRIGALQTSKTELDRWLTEADACDRVEHGLKSITLHALEITSLMYRGDDLSDDRKSVPVVILELTTEVTKPNP